MNINKLLKNTFGFNQFRNQQEEIIQTVLNDSDVLVIMPTGGGKSLCYQIPALAKEGIAIVVSPLIALMNDQVAALRLLGIPAATLHSNIHMNTSNEVIQSIQNAELKILYVSPEKLLSNGFIPFLKECNVSLFAIDEAHCVSIWGNDFRPEYVKLSILKKEFPNTPVIALTATADQATQQDILRQLNIDSAQTFLSSFERQNIKTEAKSGIKRAEQILRFLLNHTDEPGIIYCLSRKSTENMAEKLSTNGYKAKAYHAGLEAKIRNQIQTDFQNDEIQIVCATIAFGMGIDKPNIRFVIHYNMPKNIEGYYQEIGRAGRDGAAAEALLFYSWADFTNLQRFIDESQADEAFKIVQKAKLDRMWQFATTLNCRTNLVLNYFGEYRNDKCDHCDNCITPPQLIDGTKYTQMALSAILRTQSKVGLNLLIDILRGSYKQEIRQQNFHLIKTFGIGRNISFVHWRHYITQMINQGLIAIDYTDSSKLKPTPLSDEVLRNKIKVELAEYVAPEKRKKVMIPKTEIDLSTIDDSLLSKLKSWRKDLAQQQNVPAYIILGDKSLNQIASLKPDSTAKLLSIDGIGPVKLEKYGDQIMDLINQV